MGDESQPRWEDAPEQRRKDPLPIAAVGALV